MKQKLLTIFIIAIVIGSFQLVGGEVTAKTIQELEKEINELENEQSDLKSEQRKLSGDKQEIETKMDENLEEQQSIQEQIDDIDNKLLNTKSDINVKEAEIAETDKEITNLESEIKELKKEIKELEDKINRRFNLLKDRLRSIQESGGFVKYISVIFGSESFGDLISRSSTVSVIMDSDKTLMVELEQDQKTLEKKQKEVESKRAEVEKQKEVLEGQKSTLVELKNVLDSQLAEQARLKEKLEEEYGKLEEYNLSIEEEQQIIADQARALEKAKQLAADEKTAIEEEERKRIEQEQQNANGNNTSGNGNGGGGDSSNDVIVGGSGSFIWPASGRFSSGFGPRWGTNHNGIDIAASRGTPVYASASGVVSTVVTGCVEGNKRCGGGYGNYIIVTHIVNGNTFATLYGHLSNVNVSSGQVVSQGQQIGGIGHTGDSTGPHLHFEIHPGGYKNPANPMSYLK